MLTVFTMVLFVAAVPALLIAAYLGALTAMWRRPVPVAPSDSRWLAVLVPAHNEAGGITRTIASLRASDYRQGRRRIIVIADNCTDDTAAIARAAGAEVIERHDDTRRGKGYALQTAIDQLLTEPAEAWDSLVVVDADTEVDANTFKVLAGHLATGADAVQAAYLPTPGTTPTSVLTDVAFAAFHLVRSGARERLGLSCGLRGNGMAFSRTLLAAVPHTAHSRTEDLEFGVQLGLRGIRVAFAGDTRVRGEMPERAAVVTRQRERWIGGRAAIARTWFGSLLRQAWTTRSVMALDLAIDLIVPPISAVVMAAAAGLMLSLTAWLLGGSAVPAWMFAASLVIIAAHAALAAVLVGRSRDLLRALGHVPAYAWGKAVIAMRGLRRTPEVWVRTTREGESL
ncbi:MAG: N-acetylglucosaminyltransferase [Acidimicrobiia bacterium]